VDNARTLILEAEGKELTVTLHRPVDASEVYWLFVACGIHPLVTLAEGVARVTF
jgi:hypothetical protein